ncbi:MAG: homocitrate synthase [Lachnospiraceae bacterium]|nr:homocitrate synthase [Lachnospiraceae bacterium]
MQDNIQILDCTLRDGGHIVDGNFGEQTIKNVIKKLIDAKIDIIEIGFLWEKICGKDYARYYSLEDVKKILPKDRGVSHFSLMADFIDVDHLEPCDGTIEYIRLSFKRHRLEWGLNAARILMDKGYKCYINPVNCNVYTDEQYLEVLKKVNELHPYGFSIVDTFGVMRCPDLSRVYYLVEHNLDPDICIGVHLHENLGLAFTLAQHFLQIRNPQRKVSVDGSLLGMGRVPGNLCIEQIMDHLNIEYGHSYSIDAALDAIDAYIAPIKAKEPWGYSIPYYLSAKFHLHRTYGEYLANRGRLTTKDIQRILAKVDRSEAEMFNEAYIEGLYKEYMNIEVDDDEAVNGFKKLLDEYERYLIIAPGQSIKQYEKEIREYAEDKNTCVISVNFVPGFVKAAYVFCTSAKRYSQIEGDDTRMIITSNLLNDGGRGEFCFSYNALAYFDDVYCDDSTVMALALMKKCGVNRVSIAGFDGFKNDTMEAYRNSAGDIEDFEKKNRLISDCLEKSFTSLEIDFLTPSAHNKK